MKIRDDLEGFVHVHAEGGVVVLKAGDTIPDGVEVGEHLTVKAEPEKGDADAGIKPRRGRPARPATDD